ncbi:MAG TPA: hypothetical protein VHX44_02665, partial [Planctomycetota bacterium]|nr:hypothetical protein [Planctomycetota bacterium]
SRWLMLAAVGGLAPWSGAAAGADAVPGSDARIEALEKRIAELERQAAVRPPAAPAPGAAVERVALGESEDIDPLATRTFGKDIPGNVWVGDKFRIQLGGSLRLHTQYNSTSVGENVSKALLPSSTNADEDAFRMFASRSRLNATIVGPDVLGGQTSGFIEIDFQRQTSDGEGGAISTSPRLRHAYMRWAFKDVITDEGQLRLTIGQTGSAWDLTPDTVDGNTMLGGLGAANRRNPRIESVLALPFSKGQDVVVGVGIERPFFGTSTVGSDLGPGDLSGFPALSLGLGYLTTDRLGGDGFGVGKMSIGARVVYGQFDEDFAGNGFNPSITPPPDAGNGYTALAVHGGFNLQRIGFNPTGRTNTVTLVIGGIYSQGDAQHLDAGFDRRTVLQADGSLTEARSVGGFIQPIYYVTETISLRAAYGQQMALDDDRPAATGSFTGGDFVRHRNEQVELSAWWTPGPLTIGLAWNRTDTDWRRVDPATLAITSQQGSNDKVELITWYNF